MKRKVKVYPKGNAWKKRPETQIVLFQQSMKLLLLFGQFIGLNPVIGISNVDITKIKFKYLSFWFIYSVLIFLWQAMAAILCIYRLCHNPISIGVLSYVSFFSGLSTITFLFLRIAVKWPALMKEIVKSSLDKYIDSSVKIKCNRYTAVVMSLALVEHILSQVSKLSRSLAFHDVTNCTVYEAFLQNAFPWFVELGIPFNIPLGIYLQFLNIISTMNWSFSDVFIVCISFYLASVFNQINKAIQDADKRFYHPSFWCKIREDYTRAARLVSSFDDVISGVILTSFASNLFFICLQLFYVLSHGLRGSPIWHSSTGISINTAVTGTGQFTALHGSEVYFMMSFVFILSRFLAVSFVAASVHTASLAPAPALYAVPSNAYCTDVQRLQEQIHGSTVALSGLQFFYVTRGLVLSVAGTVVTYELVLLQFGDEG